MKGTVTPIRILLFDLGGVLVDFAGVREIARLLPEKASAEEIRARWSRCPHTEQFGLGRIGPREFAERFVRDWGLGLPPEEFLAAYRSWSKELYPGAAELLAALRPRFRLAALSNSNELHWARNTEELGVTGLFEVAISSHQVGLRKPDPRIFRVALDRLGAGPEAVLFFDDEPANVAAAAGLGIRACRVEGVRGVRDRLRSEGILGNSR